MNGARAAEALAARGLAARDVAAKQELFDSAIGTFAKFAGGDPERAWWIPGRLEIFGKHTDYAGGRSLIAAVPRGFALVSRARADDRVRVLDARTGESHTPSSVAAGGWRHYVDVVVHRLSHNFPGSRLGADIAFASDLPRASGLSSSSALVTGIATALARLGGLHDRPEWQQNVHAPIDAAGYFACIENGKDFGTLTGDAGVGTHGGSEDHVAILCGVAGHASAYRFVPITHIDDVGVPEAWRLVILSSGVRAAKTGAAQEPYNTLSAAAERLLESWNAREVPARSLAAALGPAAGAAERLRRIVREGPPDPWTADALERRLDHFVREDSRVPEAVHAFRDSNVQALGALAASSQQDAEALLGNQIPESSWLARTARDLEAFAACSFGAGFGGSVWAAVDRDAADAFAKRWLTSYQARWTPAYEPSVFLAPPAPAACEVT